ncbi:MAG: prepilin-type N-terminal cleavage/methylation domain-containing protein [Thermoguttaceae bacterium]
MNRVEGERRGASGVAARPVASPLATGHWPLTTGFTLIEMLIVVSIMMILVGMVATMMRPATESRRTREAARTLNVYLSSARNRAIELGRPCGVVLRCMTSGTCAMTLDQCEVPASYNGLTENSTLVVTAVTTPSMATITGTSSDFDISQISVGDTIQLNGQGPWYTVTISTVTNSVTGTLSLATGQLIPWDATGNTVSYRINRLPSANNVIKGGARPLQLPTAAVIDLSASGVGTTMFGPQDVIILFSPSGSIEYLYFNGGPKYPTDPVCLLIGKRERMLNTYNASSPESNKTNYQDLNNFWVVINPQTGLVTTGEVADSSSKGNASDAITASRTLALDMQGVGGK